MFSILAGPAARLAGIGLIAALVFGGGFKVAWSWRGGQVDGARAAQQAAQQHYEQLRAEVGAAMQAAADRAVELEEKHEQSAKQVEADFGRRMFGVLAQHERVLDLAKRRGQVRPGPVPKDCPTPILDDPAAVRELALRAGEADAAEARLIALQQLISEQ